MAAYRLHFEPATIDTIKQIREGKFGELRPFSSTFSQSLNPANHRVKNDGVTPPERVKATSASRSIDFV